MEGSKLTDEQIRLFGKMMYEAFVEIRSLAWVGFLEQAGALADAFHNLPLYLFTPSFDWEIARMHISRYQTKYPTVIKDDVRYGSYNDYLAMFDEIRNLS